MPDPNEDLLAAITRLHMAAGGLRVSQDELRRHSIMDAIHARSIQRKQHDPLVVDMVRGEDGVWREANG